MKRALASLVVAVAAQSPSLAASDVLSDNDLAARVGALFATTETPSDRVIGLHKGLPVIIDLRCGDVCPAATIRIVHYVGDADAACKITNGDLINIAVPRGMGVGPEKFCIPHALASRKTYADKPFQR